MSDIHIYNRGAHKSPIFLDKSDYERMLKLLYIANCPEPFQMKRFDESGFFEIPRDETLVKVLAYCLMPNHVHIAVHYTDVRQTTRFMRKLTTAYSKYFNKKYGHSGTIWQGKYKQKPVSDDRYLSILVDYIHLNPYGIEEPDMAKEARIEHAKEAIAFSKNYEYSSYRDYLGEKRPQGAILADVRHRTVSYVRHQRLPITCPLDKVV